MEASLVTFSNEQASKCDICMCQMKNGSECTLSCCKQTIHKKCLLKWAVTKRTEYLTCPFCRSVVLDIFNYIPLNKVSRWLVCWNYNHSIVVRGKNVQILIDQGSAPSAAFYDDNFENDTNDDEENNVELPQTANQTAFEIQVEPSNDKGIFLCVLIFALIAIIVIPIIIIVTMTEQQ